MSELKTIRVGKRGLTDALVGEISIQLKKYKRVRVKILKSAKVHKEETASDIATRTGARVLDVRGNTFKLSK